MEVETAVDEEDGQGGRRRLVDRVAARVAEVLQVGDSADASSSSSDSPPVLSVSVSIEAEPSLRALLALLAALTKAGTDGHATALQLARRLDARGLANAVLAWAQLRCKRNSERVCRLGSKLKAHRLLSNYLGPSNGGMQEPEGPLEVVVLGTTTVLQVMLSARAAASEEAGLPGHSSSQQQAVEELRLSWGRWASTLLSSPRVCEAVHAAASQGHNRDLSMQALDLLTLVSLRGGADWVSLADVIFQSSQRRGACLEELSVRLEETELAMEEAAAVASQRAAALLDEQARMDALRERYEREVSEARESLSSEVVGLREAMRHMAAEHQARAAEMDAERRRALECAEEAESRLMQERVQHDAAKEEVAGLRKQVGTFTDLLSKLEKESKAWDKRARCTQEEVDELRQGLLERDLLRIEAEQQLKESLRAREELEGKLEETYGKLIALAKAYKAKEEAGKRTEARLQQLDSEVKHAEGQLQELRVRLSQEAVKAKEVATRGDRALAAKDAEMKRISQEMARVVDERQCVKSQLEARSQECARLEREVGGLREVVGRKDQQLCEKDESLRKYLHLAAMINRMTTAPLDDSTATGLGSSGGSRGEAMMMMEGGGATEGRL